MEEVSLEELILKLLESVKKPLTFEEIVRRLNADQKSRKALKKSLRKLKKAGKLNFDRGRYSLGEEEVVSGRVIPYPAGFGFLELGEGKKDIYIPPFEMARLFGGDLIRAKVVKYKGKKEIRVIKVLKRAKKELLCKVHKEKRSCLGIPIDENQHQIIKLEGCDGIKEGTLVVVELKRFPTKEHPALGRIKEVLGHPEEKNLTIEVLTRKHNLPTSYPEEVLKEVERLQFKPEKEVRKDLREQLCFTIDPERAKDFDDAVAIEKSPEGYRLWVHIADVSYFVKEGSATDREAFRRGFTFYLPDRALHMLPEKLSAELCSLKPGEDRVAFTCEMLFDERGRLLQYDLYESLIRSKARLTYGEALRLIVGDPALEGKYAYLVEPLRHMENLYRILSRARWERGSIDFDLPEAELVVDEYGEPVAVIPYERHVAHRIIEQFMVCANETVAMHLEKAGYPCLYRVHEKPDPTKVENLLEILAGLGYRVKRASLNPKFFQSIIEDFEGRPEENLVRFLTLRSMKRAHYSPHNLGHFGLASEHYTHFTSPIRRYADIIVHRLLKRALRGEEVDYGKTLSYLEMAGLHLSQQERLAEKVEREAIDRLKARFMKAHLGEEFEGIITGVLSFGLFVEVREYLVEGLVNITALKEDQYIYDEPAHRLVGVNTGKVFRLGDRVRVKVVGVDEERARVELVLL
ncbi:MAG: ribonuclease R [Aquificaceae bacterium]|nr:ribonuclease R [Aquificaceae bacterium]MCX7989178.1 ribonuclease R [Aquificaceae bacterium]MDW8032469.1 ribonuclease R [Aquificaceae bacterium]MDW8294259.1 ribonuclease R [Aquificaceae bacterium]